MREDFWFDSCGAGRIHVCRWMPEGEPKAVFQIVHGIAEVAERYDAFAQVLAQRGFVVVADDHMGHGESVGEGDTNGYFTGGWFSAAFGPEVDAYIEKRGKKYHLDLKQINAMVLRRCGVEHIDISDDCTVCSCDRFWSHRATGGERGSQGAVIVCQEVTG